MFPPTDSLLNLASGFLRQHIHIGQTIGEALGKLAVKLNQGALSIAIKP
jgi:hypothetical protein